MTPPLERPGIERVLAELGWLRALARELCRDPHAADDAVQETMTAALLHRPDLGRPVRGWLATVLANAVRGAQRTTRRRAQREQVVARGEPAPPAGDVAARVEQQQTLLAAIRDLPEPLRATMVLRWLDELPPRRIAAQLGVPVATVKARLQRGLAELRVRLDRRHGGDRRAWVTPLAVLPPLTASLAMSKPLVFAGSAALAVLLLVCTPLLRDGDAIAAPPTGAAVLAAAVAAVPVEPAAPAAGARTDARAAVATPPLAATALAALGDSVHGVLVDVQGTPLPALAVLAADHRARAPTDANGRFELPSLDRGDGIRVDAPGWTTVLAGLGRRGARDSIVVAARVVAVRGTVVTPTGQAIAGAHVALKLPTTLRASLPLVLDDCIEPHVATDCAGDSSFALCELPAVEHAQLRASAAGFAPSLVPLPLQDHPALRIELTPTAVPDLVLAGTVLDRTGQRVTSALVVLGNHSAVTARDGTFAIPSALRPRDRAELVAVAVGSLPGRVAPIGVAPDGNLKWPEPLVVQLGGPTLAITGQVLRSDGTPASGARVWVNDLAYLGRRGDPDHLEQLHDCYLENELRGAPEGWQPVRADTAGRFRIDGLCDRDYHVTAMCEDSVLRADRTAVPAGSAIELRFDAAAVLAEVRGRVTDRAGQPLAQILVRATTIAYGETRDGWRTRTWMDSGGSTRTDANGKFTLRDLPRQRAYLRFDGDDVLPMELGQDQPSWPFAAGDELRVVMARRCHFRVELLDAATADELELRDGADQPVHMDEFLGGSSRGGERFGITAGRSGTLAAAATAQTLVLYRDDQEVRRAPLVLVAGQVTVVQF